MWHNKRLYVLNVFLACEVCVEKLLHMYYKAGVSNSRPGGQIWPVTSFSVAPQELAKNFICLLYGYMPIYRSTFCYIPWNALNILIAMNTLNALTINTLKNVICGSRGAVKSTTNYFSRPTCLSAFHLVHKLISCRHWSCVRSCVLEEGLCKEVWRKGQIFFGCVVSNSSALELVSPFLPTLPLTMYWYCKISQINNFYTTQLF